jgi:hypothetical protein
VSVFGTLIDFNLDDEIYHLARLKKKKSEAAKKSLSDSDEAEDHAALNTCRVCKDVIKNYQSNRIDCNFCYQSSCNPCATTLREFPN